MSANSPIFLKPGMTVNIDGKDIKVEDLKEHVIDSLMYRKHLKELMAKSE